MKMEPNSNQHSDQISELEISKKSPSCCYPLLEIQSSKCIPTPTIPQCTPQLFTYSIFFRHFPQVMPSDMSLRRRLSKLRQRNSTDEWEKKNFHWVIRFKVFRGRTKKKGNVLEGVSVLNEIFLEDIEGIILCGWWKRMNNVWYGSDIME